MDGRPGRRPVGPDAGDPLRTVRAPTPKALRRPAASAVPRQLRAPCARDPAASAGHLWMFIRFSGKSLEAAKHKLPRAEPDEQPPESSQLEPIEPEQWPAGELARGAERHQTLEEAAGRPLRAEAAKLGEGARRDGVVGEERAQAGRAALAARSVPASAHRRAAPAGKRKGAMVSEAGGVCPQRARSDRRRGST